MTSNDVDAVVTGIDAAIRAALSPVVGRLRALETAAAALTTVQATIATLAAAPPVPEPSGPPGPPGADGAGLDVLTGDYDDERTVTFTFGAGGKVRKWAIVLPVMIYRGVYVSGRLYERGDCVTLDGSIFHCDADTTVPPGTGAKGWTLAVKRGKDAR
jgi:hypothetical protein